MNPAGYILTGMRKHRRRAHSPLILAHSLSSEFFGIEEREGCGFPTSRASPSGRRPPASYGSSAKLDRPELAGQSSLEHFDHWRDPRSRTVTLCSREETKRARWQAKERAQMAV